MKNLILIIIAALIPALAGGQNRWSKLHDFSIDTAIGSANSAQFIEDGFFIAAGEALTDSGRQLTTYIATFDYNLNLIKKRYLYAPGVNNRIWGGNNAIVKMGPDKYAVVGAAYDTHENSRMGRSGIWQPFMFIFNKNLDSLGYRQDIDTVKTRCPYAITTDKQKNILLTGLITSDSIYYNASNASWACDSSYIWVAKYDSLLNPLWSKKYLCYKAPADNWGYKILPSHDSLTYILTGLFYDTAQKNWQNFFSKLDTNGNIIWTRTLLKPRFEDIYDIDMVQSQSGGYLFIANYSDSIISYRIGSGLDTMAANCFFYYGKINENGDTLWTKKYRRSGEYLESQGEKIVEAANRNILLFGTSANYIFIPTVVYTDSNGNVKWDKEYIYNNNINVGQQLSFISYTNKNQILMSGAVSSSHTIPGVFDTVGSLSWFVLTDSSGCMDSLCGLAVNNVNNVINNTIVYPNPFISEITIDQTALSLYSATAILTDVLGREIFTTAITQQKQTLNLPNLPPGMYYLTLTDEGYKKTFKLIKQ